MVQRDSVTPATALLPRVPFSGDREGADVPDRRSCATRFANDLQRKPTFGSLTKVKFPPAPDMK
jgi:hypothetical protein